MSLSSLLQSFLSLFTSCLSSSSPTLLHVNSRPLKLLRLLGEGGFSYVYLVSDPSTSPAQLYALKKIRCPFGRESVAQALREVEAYNLFSSSSGASNIIRAIDYEVKNEGAKASGIGEDGDGDGVQKTVYILLPYYQDGNLQDLINKNLVEGTRVSERRLCRILVGVCRALRGMHEYRKQGQSGKGLKSARRVRDQAREADMDMAVQAGAISKGKGRADAEEEEEEEQTALMPDSEITSALENRPAGTPQSYAHRDIKPANIMLTVDGNGHEQAILMDLGSLAVSPTPIPNRSVALEVQDTAAEHSTLPYRAPELFDVKTGIDIDTKVDIWSLGCTIYACLVGKSPFEARSEETGGSLGICIVGADWRWPDEGAVKPVRQGTIVEQAGTNGSADIGKGKGKEKMYPSQGMRDIVASCLKVEPTQRPDVSELMGMIEKVMSELPEDEDNGTD